MVKRRRITFGFMFSGILFVGLFIGFYNFALHVNMDYWVKNHLVITRVNTKDKVVALTFDDGPDAKTTSEVLKSLARHNARATFFIVGCKIKDQTDLVKKMASGGHEVSNHSYSHKDFNHMSGDEIRNEIRITNNLIYKITGQKPGLFRPPGGYLSNELIRITQKEKIKVAYWSWETDSKDWKNSRSARAIADHICNHIAPGQIIILHDGCTNSMNTAAAVDLMLTELSKQGYRFVTMTELINLENKV